MACLCCPNAPRSANVLEAATNGLVLGKDGRAEGGGGLLIVAFSRNGTIDMFLGRTAQSVRYWEEVGEGRNSPINTYYP